MTRLPLDREPIVAAEIAERYLAALTASGNTLVADEQGREARRTGCIELSLQLMRELSPDVESESLQTAKIEPEVKQRHTSLHDAADWDFDAIAAAAAVYVQCAERPLADATGRTSDEVSGYIAIRLAVVLGDVHRRILSRTLELPRGIVVIDTAAKCYRLTYAETNVLLGLSKTDSNTELADLLLISRDTLKKHINSLGHKIQASGRTSILHKAFGLGILVFVPLTTALAANTLDLVN